MTKNSRGRKPQGRKPEGGDDPGTRIRDVRRAYRRPRHYGEWLHDFEGGEIEELEDFEELSDFEDRELDDLEESIEPEGEEHS